MKANRGALVSSPWKNPFYWKLMYAGPSVSTGGPAQQEKARQARIRLRIISAGKQRAKTAEIISIL
jgi:hypothetical protein